jgi:hypothetical protein
MILINQMFMSFIYFLSYFYSYFMGNSLNRYLVCMLKYKSPLLQDLNNKNKFAKNACQAPLQLLPIHKANNP